MSPYLVLFSALWASAPQSSPGDYRISAEVNQVVLPVTVVDRKGRLVRGLRAEQFRVYQDGRPQQIRYFSQRDVPVSVGLVIDNSASMTPKHHDTVLAALHFVRRAIPRTQPSSSTSTRTSVSAYPRASSSRATLRSCGRRCSTIPASARPRSTMPLPRRSSTSQGTRDKKALIVVSDGGDNASRRSLQDVLDLARCSDVLIYTIGLLDPADSGPRPGVLKKLARLSGGKAFLPDDPREIAGICGRIARDLRNQYTLAYSPDANSRDGQYHRIQVVAIEGGRKLAARTRAGYVAAAEDKVSRRTSR